MLRWLRRRKARIANREALGRRLYLGMQTEACAGAGCGHCQLKLKIQADPRWAGFHAANGEEAARHAP